jgi:hypothetical protein
MHNFWNAQRYRIEYRTHNHAMFNTASSDLTRIIMAQLEDCDSPQPIWNSGLQFGLLNDAPKAQGRPLTELLRTKTLHSGKLKAFKQERVGLALGLVNWVMLLRDTTWTLALCACRLRRTLLRSSRGLYALQARLDQYSDPPCFYNLTYEVAVHM